jgi:hypothetical protein
MLVGARLRPTPIVPAFEAFSLARKRLGVRQSSGPFGRFKPAKYCLPQKLANHALPPTTAFQPVSIFYVSAKHLFANSAFTTSSSIALIVACHRLQKMPDASDEY